MSSLVRKRGVQRLVNHLIFISYDNLEHLLTTKEMIEFLKERELYEKIEHAFSELGTAWASISNENERFMNSCIKYGIELEKELDEKESKGE